MTAVTALDARVDALEGEVPHLAQISTVAALDARVTTLENATPDLSAYYTRTETDDLLGGKANAQTVASLTAEHNALEARVDGLGATYATHGDVDTRITAVVGAAPEALDTLQEIAAALAEDDSVVAALTNTVSGVGTRVDALEARPEPDLTPYAKTTDLAALDGRVDALEAVPAPDLTPYAKTADISAQLLPAGGTVGQALIKTSDADFAAQWGTPAAGGGSMPAGGTDRQALMTQPDGSSAWENVSLGNVNFMSASTQPGANVITNGRIPTAGRVIGSRALILKNTVVNTMEIMIPAQTLTVGAVGVAVKVNGTTGAPTSAPIFSTNTPTDATSGFLRFTFSDISLAANENWLFGIYNDTGSNSVINAYTYSIPSSGYLSGPMRWGGYVKYVISTSSVESNWTTQALVTRVGFASAGRGNVTGVAGAESISGTATAVAGHVLSADGFGGMSWRPINEVPAPSTSGLVLVSGSGTPPALLWSEAINGSTAGNSMVSVNGSSAASPTVFSLSISKTKCFVVSGIGISNTGVTGRAWVRFYNNNSYAASDWTRAYGTAPSSPSYAPLAEVLMDTAVARWLSPGIAVPSQTGMTTMYITTKLLDMSAFSGSVLSISGNSL
ncbi:hypothetical protein [Deinococcus fonticola]|uniref:hypothetical protein n=1 Tax=Deinococcus fonticola TaxID=2528713 RepID=UPI001F0FADC6|nr:hypothetical protein [Deinococcus fonticola]